MPGIQASKHAKGQHEYRESKQPNAVSARMRFCHQKNQNPKPRSSQKKFPSRRKGPRNLCPPAQDPAKEHLPQSSCVPGAIRDKHVEGSKLLNVNCEASQEPAKEHLQRKFLRARRSRRKAKCGKHCLLNCCRLLWLPIVCKFVAVSLWCLCSSDSQ